MGRLPKCHTVPVAGSELDCLSFGQGESPIVILPGLSTRDVKSAGLMLSVMYRSFAKAHRVYVFDKKRHIPEGCTVKMLAEDTAEAMKVLGIKNAHVLGVSLGGMMAQELALSHPELVRSLVLGLTLSKNNPSVKKAIYRWIQYMEKGDFAGFGRDMFESMYSPVYLEKYRLLLPVAGRLAKPKDISRFIKLAKVCLSCNTYEKLDALSCPTLVIGAAQDKVVTGEASREIAEKLGCTLHMYNDLGHAAYEEAKDFNKIVLDFFKNAEKQSG